MMKFDPIRDIAHDVTGEGPPVLMLHGFPQTRALWGPVAARLSGATCVAADLRGYGASWKPEAGKNCESYSFRAMGADLFALMSALGFERFHLVGHDRGARVAYRMALDAPERISSLALMDILPTDALISAWDFPVSKAYFHWSFMTQPAPFPEQMIGADPDRYFEACLIGWGGAALEDFPALDIYRRAWRNRDAIHAMCNDYRAGVGIDLEHDAEDAGRVLMMPGLVLYGAAGVMARHFDVEAIWRDRLADMVAKAVPGGHFFVDSAPDVVANALKEHVMR
ncbi:MAG: alpha/beta hydrolase [Silicimonas sp.]|jgi:haloacetate dehalogenase|nr:alpha/beta hydrolase [Silicimonas sp.]